MKPFVLVLLLTILPSLSACTSRHFYRIQEREVTLVLRWPDARSVMLATSLDGFFPRPAAAVSDQWEVTLPANKSFRYFYQVDGKVVVPDCELKETDDFGSANCIFEPSL